MSPTRLPEHLESLKTESQDWLLWQLADSAFPTGGFAHSGGLESAFQHGLVRTRAELLDWLQAALQQLSRSSLLFVAAAYDQSQSFHQIDCLCDAFTSNHVANRASRLQGNAFLNSCHRAFGAPPLAVLRQRVREFNLAGHFAPLFGTVTHVLGVERIAALRLFVFGQMRGWISSAVRLNIVGPLEAQSLQSQIAPLAERTLIESLQYDLESLAQNAPLIDLLQGAQDRLYSRLFQS